MRTLLAFLLCATCACWAQDKTVVLYTSLAPSESGPLAKAFEKKSGIKVEVWRALSEKEVQREDLPVSYQGFLDPRWKGRIGLEATDAEWMATLVKKWGEKAGMAYFRRLADMKPDMRKGHVLLAELIAAGEIPVGLTVYNANAESLKRRGAPIDWVPVQP